MKKQLRTEMPTLSVRVPAHVIQGLKKLAADKRMSLNHYLDEHFREHVKNANSK